MERAMRGQSAMGSASSGLNGPGEFLAQRSIRMYVWRRRNFWPGIQFGAEVVPMDPVRAEALNKIQAIVERRGIRRQNRSRSSSEATMEGSLAGRNADDDDDSEQEEDDA